MPKQSWENNKVGDIIFQDFRLYYKATVIKTPWYQLSLSHTHTKPQRSRNNIERTKINPCTCNQLIYNKQEYIWWRKQKNIQWRKDIFFNKWCWENWTTTCKAMRLEHSQGHLWWSSGPDSCSQEGGRGSILGQGTRSRLPQLTVCILQWRSKILRATTKIWCIQINFKNKYFFKKNIPSHLIQK